MTYNSIYQSAIVIQAADIDFEREGVYSNFLAKRVENVYFIARDKSSATQLPSSYDEFASVLKNASNITNTKEDDKILIILDAHGNVDEEGNHILKLADEFIVPSKDVFKEISACFKKPVDIIFTACHGGGALNDIVELMPGSRVLVFSSESEVTFNPDIRDLMKGEYPANVTFSLDSFYDYYLFYLDVKTTPIIAEVGGDVINPYASFAKYLGKTLNNSAKEYVLSKLGKFCDEVEECYEKVAATTDKLEQVASADDLFTKSYYSGAVEEIFKYELSIANTTIFQYLHAVELGQSPAFIKQITLDMDSIFERYQIPLSVDLSKINGFEEFFEEALFIKDDVKERDEMFYLLSKFKDQDSDRALYKAMLEEMEFKPNNHFPLPEKQDYGVALLAVKYLDEYCLDYDCFMDG